MCPNWGDGVRFMWSVKDEKRVLNVAKSIYILFLSNKR